MAVNHEPQVELHPQYSSEGATPPPWPVVCDLLEKASIYWVTTVRPDGRPHITPLYAVWMDDVFYFCTGSAERKARNVAHNTNCAVTTGCNIIEGFDVVIEGKAVQISDEALLHGIADKFAAKYDWHYEVRDGAFHSEGRSADVYKIAPTTAFSFGKGDTFSQTRYRF